ncbi:MAG: hypothetical protein ACK595_08435, partial [Planctomycetota bacterium]
DVERGGDLADRRQPVADAHAALGDRAGVEAGDLGGERRGCGAVDFGEQEVRVRGAGVAGMIGPSIGPCWLDRVGRSAVGRADAGREARPACRCTDSNSPRTPRRAGSRASLSRRAAAVRGRAGHAAAASATA